jgi:FtsP/CotA-like multicopper oxidase with cupredoxin domain
MPMGNMTMPMLPGMASYVPPLTPFLPGMGVDINTLPMVQPREVHELTDGDTLALDARLVRKAINGRSFVMYGFNGQHPGPLIRVREQVTIVIVFTNHLDLPTTVHWHGLRLDNRFDGVPGLTQEPVQPGETFTYRVFFPDPGIFWYHPHVREDIQQELGLYGNMLVESADPAYYSPVNREEFLILDDLLLDGDAMVPFGLEAGNYTLMGRFGNLFLINGEPEYELTVNRGDVVRMYLTNVANTRVYNLVFGDAPMKVVGADVGKFEREEWVKSVVIAPAQRYVVEARFERPGRFPITNRVQAIDHFLGEFYPAVDTIGFVTVQGQSSAQDHSATFDVLRENDDVIADIDRYRPHFDRSPDQELVLSVQIGDLPQAVVQFMSIDTTYYPPVEWSDAMPMMNWVSNGRNVKWVVRDADTGAENMDISWEFAAGDIVKIRLFNDPNALHPMSHPIHLHGQRFLVVARNGLPNRNLVWKDTVLVPVGSTVDILLDVTNPGAWMLHCHIAEHLEAGMMSTFTVTGASGN